MIDPKDFPDSNEIIDLEAPGIVNSSCEFCKLRYYIDPENLTVIHTWPPCPEFQGMDPLPFVIENRKIKQAKVNNSSGN